MIRALPVGALVVWVALLGAADPVWKAKSVAEWTENDAREVLANSPWVKRAVVAVLPELSAQQRREGGATGGGHGVGLDGLNGKGDPRAKKQVGPISIRWESASPVRAAELKAREVGAPDWEGDAYVLAVYDVPDVKAGTNTRNQLADLRQVAFLKRSGKKDLKPDSVQLLQEPSGLSIVVYVFPRTEDITLGDERIEFTAQINRISVAQYFFPAQMEMNNKLQL
ncbi:MAG TPA: hypothetical protein VKG79_13415 [Bryobacteraceae bacterium]|nr:hypothetical protein [Bryobacteraceae bacterium]